MLAGRASDSHIVIIMAQAFKDFLTFADYQRAKDAASDLIVRRQARGSINAQNGWIINDEQLQRMSEHADRAMDHLRKAFG
jgi:hypothetical protein